MKVHVLSALTKYSGYQSMIVYDCVRASGLLTYLYLMKCYLLVIGKSIIVGFLH